MADPMEAARAVDADAANVTTLPRKTAPTASTTSDARLDARAALELRAHIASGYAAFLTTTRPVHGALFTADLMMRLEAAFAALGIVADRAS